MPHTMMQPPPMSLGVAIEKDRETERLKAKAARLEKRCKELEAEISQLKKGRQPCGSR